MKVVLVVPGFSADADDWCIPALRQLVRRLAETVELEVFALRYPARTRRYRVFGARVTAFGGGALRGVRGAMVWARALAELVAERRRGIDVLHSFWADETGAFTALAGRSLDVPTIVSIAGGELVALRDIGYGGLLRRRERIKTRLALGLASLVTVGSAPALGRAARAPKARDWRAVRRVPLGVDIAMFSPEAAASRDGRMRILNVASLTPVKDHATLLRAAAILRDRGRSFELEIVGSGPLKAELCALATELHLDAVVRFRGSVAHDELPAIYRAADVFALSSRHEAQCMAALEAAASGLPLVGTPVGVMTELAPRAARLAPVGDPVGLARAIGELLDDREALRRSAECARTLAVSEFSLERCADRFLALYEECARSGVRRDA
jgi:glycosyltransferase involved in cell wall biosynthesis